MSGNIIVAVTTLDQITTGRVHIDMSRSRGEDGIQTEEDSRYGMVNVARRMLVQQLSASIMRA